MQDRRTIPAAEVDNGGFTLIELLVVFSIIMILTATLLPALNWSRDAAHSARCVSNLREIGIFCHMYESDHGWLPPNEEDGSICFFPLQRVVSQSGLVDASAVYTDQGNRKLPWYMLGTNDFKADYLYNPQAYCDYGPYTGNGLGITGFSFKRRRSDETFYTFTQTPESRDASRTELARDVFNQYYYSDPWEGFLSGVHNGRTAINAVYMDGHVETKPLTDPDVYASDPYYGGNPYSGVWGWDCAVDGDNPLF